MHTPNSDLDGAVYRRPKNVDRDTNLLRYHGYPVIGWLDWSRQGRARKDTLSTRGGLRDCRTHLLGWPAGDYFPSPVARFHELPDSKRHDRNSIHDSW